MSRAAQSDSRHDADAPAGDIRRPAARTAAARPLQTSQAGPAARGQTAPREGSQDAPAHGDAQKGGSGARWLWALLAVALLALGGGVFWWLSQSEPSAEADEAPAAQLVRTAEVRAAERLEIRQTGFVRPLFEVEVAADVGGRISRLGPDFRRGARIEAGALLVQLDPDTYRVDLEQAQAALEEARAGLTEARIARERAEALEDREFATEERLQNAILGEARAEAQLASARAGVSRASRALDDTSVEAPFAALVTGRSAAPGQFVQAGAPLGRLVALQAAEAEMSLTPADLMLLGDLDDVVGAEVALHATGPEPRPLGSGVVTDVNPRIEQRTRTTGLIVRIDGAFDRRDPRPLRVDELVQLTLPARLPEGGVVALPPAALKDRSTVWRVRDGALERVDVTVLQRGEGRVHVLSDRLSPGDRVMLSDIAAPVEGQAVRVAEDPES